MRENDTVQLLLVDGKPTACSCRPRSSSQVVDTEPGVKGDTVSNVTKPATLETGAVVQVPLFVEQSASGSRSTPARRGTSHGRDPDRRHHRSAAVAAAPGGHASRLPRCWRWPRSWTPPVSTRLEVTGGGCFDAAVRRGTESPWERVRALKARCTRRRCRWPLRGRFLVGSRPVSDDLIRRFILCAAESGIDIFRLHDPLNDVENLAAAAAAVREAGGRLYAGLAFSGEMANLERVLDKARRLAELGADHVLLHDPAGALDPGHLRQRGRAAGRGGGRAGRVCTARDGGSALAMAIEAARDGAEPMAVAAYPVANSLNRVPGRGAVRGPDRPGARARRGCRAGVGARRSSSTSTSPRRCRRCRSRRGSRCAPPASACRWGSWPTSTPVCAGPARSTGWTRCWTS